MGPRVFLLAAVCLGSAIAASDLPSPPPPPTSTASVGLALPRLEAPPTIDGDLSEWRELALHDGVWDIHRVRHSPWYDGGTRNRLTLHGDEPSADEDLQARYFMAWDERYLYLGAEVRDNVNDIAESRHEPKRWYYKDAIAWFIEAPRDAKPEKFSEGNHGFAFVIDASYPAHGAWWRHGTRERSYVEEPLPARAVQYRIRMNPWGRSPGDFVLEARIEMAATFGAGSPAWTPPREGDLYSLCIVHTDPDGGEYGGHLLIHGTGDDDASWTPLRLSGPESPVQRKER